MLSPSLPPALKALAMLAVPANGYGTSSVSPITYVSVAIFMATYLLTWMGMRAQVTLATVDASAQGERSPSPIRTTLHVIASFCNILFVALIAFMVMGLLDLTVVEMLWSQHKGPRQRVSAFSSCAKGATRMAFSWAFNFNLLIAVAVAMAMTGCMCYIALVRLSVQVVAPSPEQVTRTVGTVLVFNLIAVAACIVLQLLYSVQWDGVGKNAMKAAQDMRGYSTA